MRERGMSLFLSLGPRITGIVDMVYMGMLQIFQIFFNE